MNTLAEWSAKVKDQVLSLENAEGASEIFTREQ